MAVAQAPRKAVAPARGGRGWLRTVTREFTNPEKRTAYLMVVPSLLVILAIAVYPMVYAIILSFQHVLATGASTGWVGLANYRHMFSDSDFRTGLKNTAVFTVLSVALEFAFGLGIALMLNRGFRGRGGARAIALVPWAYPTVVSAVMWRLMFQDQVGVMNYLALKIHAVSQPVLLSQNAMLGAAVLVDVWKTTPFMALLLLAGLQVIPEGVYEAARVDGATAVQRFWRITLPLLKPAILVALLFRTLDAWRVYDLFWAFGNQQLHSLSTYVYTGVRISELNYSVGDAAAVFIFFSSLAIAFVFIKLLGARATQ